MRQRVTFLHDENSSYSPDSLRVSSNAVEVRNLSAAREHRLTWSLKELPEELRTIFDRFDEFHVRWVSAEAYNASSPLVSRISPGLHVFSSPLDHHEPAFVCDLLKTVFGTHLKCSTLEDTFTAIPDLDNRVSSPARWQYYQLLESLEGFVEYLDQTVCAAPNNECHGRASSSLNATQIDLDYDAVSKIFIFTAFWHIGPDQGLWHETIRRSNPRDKLEVGILANEKATEAEELSLGGLVMVVGEDDHPKPTLFSFPSRHHSMPSSPSSSYTVSLPPPTGLHPSLRLTFPSPPRSPPAPHCALHTHAVLPSSLFLDKYQLSDPLFLASKNLLAVRSILGETDLEAPDWVVEKWGSSLLAEIAMPDVGHSGAWEVDIPLHLRYLRPNAGRNGVAEVQIPWPVVFWACQAPDGLKMTVNPFDRQHLGYDVLFRPRTMFYHLNPLPTSQSLIESIRVPVLDLDGAKWVEAGTVVSVVLGFVWICWTLWRVVLKSPDGIHYWGPAKEGKKRQ